MNPTPKQAEHIKWLRFAILLSQVDWAELSEGQRLDLKNEFQRFLRSMDPPRETLPEGLNITLMGLRGLRPEQRRHEAIAALVGEEDVDESCAQSILNTELETFTNPAKATASTFISNVSVTHAIVRTSDSFNYWVFPRGGRDRIVALLGHHLSGSGIMPSMLARCPECQRLFIASRKPRPDRKFHCSTACSGKAASKAYRERKNKLSRAQRMFEDGQTVNKIVKTTKLDREWLIKKLPTKPRRRSKVSAEAVRRSRKKAAG